MSINNDICQKWRGNRPGFRPLNAENMEKVLAYEQTTGKEIDEIDERSAGCVVFSHHPETKELMVMLIKNFGDWYSFPKGHVDENEDDMAAAIRETLEETGVNLSRDQLDPNSIAVRYALFGKLHTDRWVKHPDYPDESKRPKVIGYKTVTHFSAYTTEQTCVPQASELLEVKFHPLQEALELLSDTIRPQLQEHLNTSFVQKLMNTSV